VLKIKKKVVITGTFDVLHPGHSFLINEAAKLGEVYVIIARDANVKKFKGTYPTITEEQRLEMVQSLKNVKKAVLGKQDSDYFKVVEEINPDIIMLGPNQKISIDMVKEGLKEKGLEHIEVIRLEKLYDKYELHSSSLIKQKIMNNSSKNRKENNI
jgi:FAD synthetase